MRPPVDERRIQTLARELGRVARVLVCVYLTGGATAVLQGWRESTIDVDLRFDDPSFRSSPTSTAIQRSIPQRFGASSTRRSGSGAFHARQRDPMDQIGPRASLTSNNGVL